LVTEERASKQEHERKQKTQMSEGKGKRMTVMGPGSTALVYEAAQLLNISESLTHATRI
jgi:hypothetical protein